MNTKLTFNETTFEFQLNQQKTSEFDGNQISKPEHYDVIINGNPSNYYVLYETNPLILERYELFKFKVDSKGGILSNSIGEFKGELNFPLSVVTNIVNTIGK
jgi:hypothetical protein